MEREICGREKRKRLLRLLDCYPFLDMEKNEENTMGPVSSNVIARGTAVTFQSVFHYRIYSEFTSIHDRSYFEITLILSSM